MLSKLKNDEGRPRPTRSSQAEGTASAGDGRWVYPIEWYLGGDTSHYMIVHVGIHAGSVITSTDPHCPPLASDL